MSQWTECVWHCGCAISLYALAHMSLSMFLYILICCYIEKDIIISIIIIWFSFIC
jgi:hypothetical protein